MIVYSSNALAFKNDVDDNVIGERIETAFFNKFGFKPGDAERRSWSNSMQYMERIIRRSKVPDDCGILIEFGIPSTSKRIDFMITGKNSKDQDNFVIVELKQWEKAEVTDRPGIVSTFVGQKVRDTTHPSYQAWSYKEMLSDTNEEITNKGFYGHACAYLHNYKKQSNEPLLDQRYIETVQDTPIFFKEDSNEIAEYIYNHVCKGNGINMMYLIENGKLRPTKRLIDHVTGLFQGNKEFILLDEQKVAYETIVHMASNPIKKTVIIVNGGPGTGKSVISMNAFGELLKRGKNLKFIAPNAAFRDVMLKTLDKSGKKNKSRVKVLFSGSGSFVDSPENFYDVLVIDEAHRLKNEKAYMYKGENQVEDTIKSAKVTVLFVDDSQQIRPDDIGSISEIKRVAEKYSADIREIELTSQFRCSGAEGFLNWLDNTLQIKATANYDGWDTNIFEFKLCNSPNEVYRLIKEKNQIGYKARIVAGYAWNWTSEKNGNKNGQIHDVTIPEHNFSMPWNSRAGSTSWAINHEGLEQIGCVHTSQGLEFDYVGVIIGNDLKYNSETGSIYGDINEYKDSTGKKGLKNDPETLTRFIKNIYKILMSRGMKGCYIFCRDKEVQEHIQNRLENILKSEFVENKGVEADKVLMEN